ncbi:unnamed protein product [Musa acuminata var. zebrina]
MDDSDPPKGSLSGQTLSDAAVDDLDLMDELLSGSVFDCSDLLQTGTSATTGPLSSACFSPVLGISSTSSNPTLAGIDYQVDAERSVFSVELASDEAQMQMLDGGQRPIILNHVGETKCRVRSDGLEAEDPSYEPGMSRQIQPKGETGSVEQRLRYALKYIKESQREGDVLVQMWVPAMRGNQQVVTTCGQPFLLDFNCQRLVNYRSVSTRYQFLADESSHEAVGLPGRVFLGRLPEWTPDVRYFSSFEYPRVGDAQRYDVRGTIALPIFERNSPSCLGVVEVVMTTQKVNYSYDIENICNALQAVDLRSSQVLSVPRLKMTGDSYLAAIPEIQMVLRTACETHRLPLAQTWISCIQQGREGSRHSDESFSECVSTIDEACYIQDPSMLGFQQACSEHHLFRGQGVVGKAFMTNQPCFSSDVTEFSKIEYPLSHHAQLFHLRAAVAIRLRCVHSGNVDFVLEFFLPIHCIEGEEQKLMLNSLSVTIQQVCQTLRVVTTRELEDETMWENNEQIPSDMFSDNSVSEIGQRYIVDELLPSGTPAVGIPKNVVLPASVPTERTKEFEGFSVSTHWVPSNVVLPTGNIFSEVKQHHGESNSDYIFSFSAETNVSNAEKATEKRRAKTERTVSLQELQKYFAGSLKDAARSLGVCPTTLKRICRQHGITRWPSRKIKKVGRSLRKLQVVIDSVHGPGEAFQFSSLYESFIKNTRSDSNLATSTTFSLLKQTDHPESSNAKQQLEGRFTSHTSGTNSLSSSSCSQNSNSSQGCSSEQRQCNQTHEFEFRQATLVEENRSDVLNKVQIHVELHCPLEVTPKSVVRLQSQRPQIEHHPSRCDFLKVKAIYGEEKVIFRLQPTWGFQDLKQEIGRRFVIYDTTLVDIKYLDEDSEWILITCDEDLKECIDVYRSTQAQTIKLCVHHVQPTARSSLGSTALS